LKAQQQAQQHWCLLEQLLDDSRFDVVTVIFQSYFYLEMYQSIFFYFLKIIFDISKSK
jgi:hypothetical protein